VDTSPYKINNRIEWLEWNYDTRNKKESDEVPWEPIRQMRRGGGIVVPEDDDHIGSSGRCSK